MAGPIPTDDTGRPGGGLTALGLTGSGMATCTPATRAPATRALAATHVTVGIRALAATRAWSAGLARAGEAVWIRGWIRARRAVPSPGPARAWIRDGARASARVRMLALICAAFLARAPAAFLTPAWMLASARSGFAVPARAGVLVQASAGLRAPARARVLVSVHAGLRPPACAGILVLIRAEFRVAARAGTPALIRAVGCHPAPGLVFARKLVLAGRGQREVQRPGCRSPPRLARRPRRTPRARGGPGMPIRVLGRGPAPEPGRTPVPGRAAAGLGRERILAARRAGSGRAPGPRTRRRR